MDITQILISLDSNIIKKYGGFGPKFFKKAQINLPMCDRKMMENITSQLKNSNDAIILWYMENATIGSIDEDVISTIIKSNIDSSIIFFHKDGLIVPKKNDKLSNDEHLFIYYDFAQDDQFPCDKLNLHDKSTLWKYVEAKISEIKKKTPSHNIIDSFKKFFVNDYAT